MAPLLFCTIYLLAVTLSDVAARAVDINITSFPTSNSSSLILSESTNVTPSLQSCTDIKTCRMLDQIIVSCLVTILACVWFAVHRNIPAPPTVKHHEDFFARSVRTLRGSVREAATILVVGFLVPEWIVGWALRQFVGSWRLVQKLERAREEGILKWKQENGHSNAQEEVREVDTVESTALQPVQISKRSVSGVGAVQPDLRELFASE